MSKSFQLALALVVVTRVSTLSSSALAQEDDLLVPAQPVVPAPMPSAMTTDPALPPVPPPPLVPPLPSRPPDPLRADVDALREEVRQLRETQKQQRPFLAIWDSAQSSTTPWDITPGDGIWLTGYMQSEYITNQESQDQLAPGGVIVNKDRFLIRRARLKVIGAWRFAETQIEINGDTTNGFNMNLHHAEATLHYRPDPTKVPIAQVTLGLFDTPFGYELVESPRARPFMERSTMSQAFWSSEPDLGVRLSGGLGFFRWTIAAVNGYPFGSKYPGEDPIAAKDVIFRFGVDTAPRPRLKVSGDVSVLTGTGFHAGTDATKASLQWNDLSENGLVEPGDLQGIPAEAATPSQNFPHWAVGADLQTSYEDPIGWLKVYGELTIAENMGRNNFVADPILSGTNVRELGWYLGVTQEVMSYGLVGFRYDYYDPNADIFDSRGGQIIPYSDRIETFSPLVGAGLPHRAEFIVQYDINRNYLARDASGVPANLKMNQLTLRLQAEL